MIPSKSSLLLFTALGFMLWLQTRETDGRNISVCYFRSWTVYRKDKSKFLPQDIDIDLCSVINFAFMEINLTTYKLDGRPNDQDEWMVKELVKLKEKRPNLKIFVSVGGWSHDVEPRFHNMVAYKNRQHTFIRSVVAYLKKHKLDGINIDWEYPGFGSFGSAKDKPRFVGFLRRMRKKFKAQSSPYYLTLAVSASEKKFNRSYDVPKIARYVDWVNLMAYNLRSVHQGVTVCPALTFGRPPTVGHSIDAWLKRGMPASKINLGVALYGKTFELKNLKNNYLGALIVGKGRPGKYSKESGYLSYYEICAIPWRNHKMWFESGCGTPYASLSDTWVAYEDQWSIRQKVQALVNCKGLNGISIWALDFDDFTGTSCEQGRYPLLSAAVDEMKIGSKARCDEFIERKFSLPDSKKLTKWWLEDEETKR